jgi:hypothetical protein
LLLVMRGSAPPLVDFGKGCQKQEWLAWAELAARGCSCKYIGGWTHKRGGVKIGWLVGRINGSSL